MGGEIPDRRALRVAEAPWLLLQEAVLLLLLELRLGFQLLLPGPFQGARDQPMRWLDGMLWSGGPPRCVGRPFTTLLPVCQQDRPRLLDLLGGCQRHLQRGGLQGSQHRLAEERAYRVPHCSEASSKEP